MKGLVIKCSKCGFANNLTQDSALIKHKVPFECDGDTIYLTYFDCEKCGNRHYVQIDDDETLEYYQKCYKYMVKLSSAKRNKQTISQKLNSKFKDLRAKLNTKRLSLMLKYDGKVIRNGDESSILKFTLTN